MTRSSTNSQSKLESVTGTWCCYVIYNSHRSKVYVGTTRDLKDRIEKHNRLSSGKGEIWSPVIAITGFFNNKEAIDFEANIKVLAKKKEFTEYASLYPGRCPPLVLKRIIAIRCLLCEYDFCWRAPKGKKRRYVLHWGSFVDRDQRQSDVLRSCPWARVGRSIKHLKMDLSEDRPLAPETDSSNVSVTSAPEDIDTRKNKKRKIAVEDDDDDDDGDDGDGDDIDQEEE